MLVLVEARLLNQVAHFAVPITLRVLDGEKAQPGWLGWPEAHG